MYTFTNFISFLVLTTVAIRMGDPVALLICIVGFTIMHVMCEDMDLYTEQVNYNNYKLGEK
jgi:hypothetical protein